MTKHTDNPNKSSGTRLARHWRLVPLVVLGCGVSVILLGCLFNPYCVRTYISSDGELERLTVTRLFVLEGVAIFAGVLLLLSSRALRVHSNRKERLVKGLLASLASVFVMLVILECVLRVANRDGRLIRRQRHYFFEHDDYLGWKQRPGTTCYFKDKQVAINAKGLREDELPYSKPSGQFRMLFLGDSQLFGDGVAAEDTFVEVLQSRLCNVQAINAGVIGYGTDQQLLYFQREGRKFQPDLTVVTINAYDLQDNISHTIKSGYQKPLFKLQEGQLLLTNVPVSDADIAERVDRNLGRMSCLYYFLSKKLPGAFSKGSPARSDSPAPMHVFPEPEKLEHAIDLTARIVAKIAEDSRKAGADTVVLFLPYKMDFTGELEYRKKTDRFITTLREAGEQAGFLLIDIRSELAKQEIHDVYLDAMHLSPHGNEAVADVLLKCLIDTDLIPPRHRNSTVSRKPGRDGKIGSDGSAES